MKTPEDFVKQSKAGKPRRDPRSHSEESKKKTYNHPLDLLVRVSLPPGVAHRNLVAALEPPAAGHLNLIVEVETVQHPPELTGQRVFPLGERGR